MQTPLQSASGFYSTHSSSSSGYSNHAEATDSMDPEPKSDKMGIALIATLAGLLAVAGIVVPLVLLK